MIGRICLEAFRGVERACVELGPLSVVYGPPNSGKTSLLEGLALLMQSRGEQWLTLEGPLLVVHEPEDIHMGGDLSRPFAVEFSWGDIEYGYRYATAGSHVEQWVRRGGRTLARAARRGDRGEVLEPVRAELCVAPFAVMTEDALTPCGPTEGLREAERALLELRLGLKDRFYFISGRRLAAWKRTYETHVDLLPATSVGAEGQYTAHQVSRLLTLSSLEPQRELLYQHLKAAEVEDLRAGLVSAGRIALYVKRGAWANAYAAGNYTKAVLPVLVQLALANEGSTVAVDDGDLAVPEDRAEALLSAMAQMARRRGLQLVLTARSPAFARAAESLGYAVARL